MTAKGGSAWQPRWSPDGKHLGFLSVREGGEGSGAQVFTLDVRGGEAEQLTRAEHGVEDYAWSPDGSRIAFTSNRTAEPDDNFDSDIWLVHLDVPHDRPNPVRVTLNPGSDGRSVRRTCWIVFWAGSTSI